MAVATYLPSSIYYGAASGSVFPTFYSPSTNSNGLGNIEGSGVVGSLTSSTSPYSITLLFNLGTTSTAALTLRTLYTSNASTGTVKLTPNDGITAVNGSISATSPTAESQVSFSSTAPDVIYQNNTVLATAATSSGLLNVRIDFNSTGAWTQTATALFQFSVTQ